MVWEERLLGLNELSMGNEVVFSRMTVLVVNSEQKQYRLMPKIWKYQWLLWRCVMEMLMVAMETRNGNVDGCYGDP